MSNRSIDRKRKLLANQMNNSFFSVVVPQLLLFYYLFNICCGNCFCLLVYVCFVCCFLKVASVQTTTEKLNVIWRNSINPPYCMALGVLFFFLSLPSSLFFPLSLSLSSLGKKKILWFTQAEEQEERKYCGREEKVRRTRTERKKNANGKRMKRKLSENI